MACERLTCPVPYYQDDRELSRLLDAVRAMNPQKILEVGSLYGGTLWHWMEACTGSLVVSVDMVADNPQHPRENVVKARSLWKGWSLELCCQLKFYVGPSDNKTILASARAHAPYDFIFVDAGHLYEEVKTDYENYWPMLRPGGLMAFHDIAYRDGASGIGVGTWWREMRVKTGNYRMIDIIERDDNTWGIGMIWKDAVEAE